MKIMLLAGIGASMAAVLSHMGYGLVTWEFWTVMGLMIGFGFVVGLLITE